MPTSAGWEIEADFQSVGWSDGASQAPTRLRLCHRDSEHTFSKPQTYQAPVNQQYQSKAVGINDAKKKCADLGFKSGTEAFGNCVLKLSK